MSEGRPNNQVWLSSCHATLPRRTMLHFPSRTSFPCIEPEKCRMTLGNLSTARQLYGSAAAFPCSAHNAHHQTVRSKLQNQLYPIDCRRLDLQKDDCHSYGSPCAWRRQMLTSPRLRDRSLCAVFCVHTTGGTGVFGRVNTPKDLHMRSTYSKRATKETRKVMVARLLCSSGLCKEELVRNPFEVRHVMILLFPLRRGSLLVTIVYAAWRATAIKRQSRLYKRLNIYTCVRTKSQQANFGFQFLFPRNIILFVISFQKFLFQYLVLSLCCF